MKLGHVLDTAYVMFRTTDPREILALTEEKIRTLLSTDLAKVYYVINEELV
jgi:hypothetical protein